MFYKISTLFFLSVFTSLLYASQTIATPKAYTLDATLSNASILLGETTQLKLTFRYKDLEDYEIQELSFSNITVKELDSNDYTDKEGYSVEEINYSLTPQNEGNFSFSNLKVQAEIIDGQYKNFDNRSKYTQKFSVIAKTIHLAVKKLPKGITAIGDYRLSSTVDKTNVAKGEIVTLTLSLYGDGNILNLDFFQPDIQNATTYLQYTTSSKRQQLQTKVYEIIADKDYCVPAFRLLYYDKEDRLVKKSVSEAIKVSIQGYISPPSDTIEDKERYFFFLAGVISLVLLIVLYKILTRKREKKEATFIKSIKSSRTKNDLYTKVVVYLGKDKELDSLIYALEGESELSFKSIKKETIKRLVKLGLHERDNLLFTTKNTL
ncbi:BatD family protein [Sulfurimonas sp. SAG-AH-194-C20]|nr:hypothetical protein [Sulfurimonas sp. SAG-AH-194-C20]MDF1878677.1 BatD family protein [Sulfurimonas sp. SAG-AH-194-C20]